MRRNQYRMVLLPPTGTPATTDGRRLRSLLLHTLLYRTRIPPTKIVCENIAEDSQSR
jgi:hypothetical protein